MIELKSVCKAFDGQKILNNIDLKLQAGRALAIVGPSGQGKTVLLKTIAGLIPPDEGSVLINSKDLHALDKKQKAKVLSEMGMLFQKNALFDSLECGENIAFPLRERSSLNEEDIQKRIDFFLDAVDIPHAKNLFPDEISGGMQKRLGIARALALEPKIILYDDPTAGLDPITSKKIIKLIERLKTEQNSTIVFITNDMNRAYQLADELLMIHQGKITHFKTIQEAKTSKDPTVHQFLTANPQGPLTPI
ncbi:MAG: ABC transporter ATP-binding protein [Bdellovibrionales bacterium]